MPVKSKATVFAEDYMIKPGVNQKLRNADSKVWKVTLEDVTGAHFHDLGWSSGPQVGHGSDADAMGEESHTRITYQGNGPTINPKG
jgi:hypothetical protein